jgi:hypothetical protein
MEDLDAHRASFADYRLIIQTSAMTISYLPHNSQQYWEIVSTVSEGLAVTEPSHKQLSRIPKWQQFVIDAVNAYQHRRFFTTTSGYFGRGPEAMNEEGVIDGTFFIAIFFGASVPFILQDRGHISPRGRSVMSLRKLISNSSRFLLQLPSALREEVLELTIEFSTQPFRRNLLKPRIIQNSR